MQSGDVTTTLPDTSTEFIIDAIINIKWTPLKRQQIILLATHNKEQWGDFYYLTSTPTRNRSYWHIVGIKQYHQGLFKRFKASRVNETIFTKQSPCRITQACTLARTTLSEFLNSILSGNNSPTTSVAHFSDMRIAVILARHIVTVFYFILVFYLGVYSNNLGD